MASARQLRRFSSIVGVMDAQIPLEAGSNMGVLKFKFLFSQISFKTHSQPHRNRDTLWLGPCWDVDMPVPKRGEEIKNDDWSFSLGRGWARGLWPTFCPSSRCTPTQSPTGSDWKWSRVESNPQSGGGDAVHGGEKALQEAIAMRDNQGQGCSLSAVWFLCIQHIQLSRRSYV